jgi:uncharacterized protein YjdB
MKQLLNSKYILGLLVLTTFIPVSRLYSQTGNFIDHTCTDIHQIPAEWIVEAKSNLSIRYYHTSHGSHIDYGGMQALTNYSTAYAQTYNYNATGSGGALEFVTIYGLDLSANENDWDDITRNDLDSDPDCNVVMWSWCNIYGHSISDYLDKMETLISEYGPGGSLHRANPVTFIFMTGHTNGGIGNQTENEWTFEANNTIREHCRDNNRWLFDFNDIECYDPDGNYFGDGNPATGAYVCNRLLHDDCSYNINSSTRGNWGIEWMNDNPSSELTDLAQNDVCQICAHSDGTEAGKDNSRLQCVLKGQAAWWMFARLAGWQDTVTSIPVTGITVRGHNNATTITTSGGTLQMYADVLPSDATTKSVHWTVQSITGQATVSSSGLLTARGDGTVRVVATATDGSGVSGNRVITLSNQNILVSDIEVTTIDGNSIYSIAEESVQMLAEVNPDNASNKTVDWVLYNNDNEASITSGGLLTFLNPGEVNVVATANDGTNVYGYYAITITNDIVYIDSIHVQGHDGKHTINIHNGILQMQALIFPDNATNDSLEWVLVNDTGTASLDEDHVLHAISDGNVIVRVNAKDGSEESGEAVITIAGQNNITGISDFGSSDTIEIFPNPANNIIYIRNNSLKKPNIGQQYNVTIITLDGQTVLQHRYEGVSTEIDIHHLKEGIYFINMSGTDSQIVRKLIVSH